MTIKLIKPNLGQWGGEGKALWAPLKSATDYQTDKQFHSFLIFYNALCLIFFKQLLIMTNKLLLCVYAVPQQPR